MIDFIRHILAVPLELLLLVARIVPVIPTLPLVKAIWDLTADPQWGSRLINETAQATSLSDARALTDRMLSRVNDGQLYLAIGNLELQQAGDPVAAYNWVQRARQTGCSNDEWLLYLELLLSRHLPQCDAGAIANQILARNDLPMHYTATALSVKMQLAIRNRDFQQAKHYLDRMLAVQDDPHLNFFMWLCLQGLGDTAGAEQHRRVFAKKTPPDKYFLYMADGWFGLGDMSSARENIRQAMENGVTREQIEEFNAELIKLLD